MPRRLLIVDDVPTNRILLKAKLTAAGYAVDLAGNVAGAISAIKNRLPDVAMISCSLDDDDARHLPRLLNAKSVAGRVPVILMNGGTQAVMPSENVDAVVELPSHDGLLLARLRSVLRVRDLEEELEMRATTCRELGMAETAENYTKQPHILLVPRAVDDGVELADELSARLSCRITILPLPSVMARLDQRGEIDVVLFDADPVDPTQDLHVLSDLRCRAETRHAGIVMRVPINAEIEAGMALDLGASDVIVGDPGAEYISAVLNQQIRARDKLRRLRAQVQAGLKLAVTDPLTGLYNRRYALSHLERQVVRSKETGRALAVMVLDIDRFKNVNDRHGHQMGDEVLAAVGQTLADNLRGADLLSRFGGEEFLITMPDTTVSEARQAAERLCKKVAGLGVTLPNGTTVSVTLSIGLAVRVVRKGAPALMAEKMIADADRALFRSKNDGRNQVTLSRSAA